MVDFFFGSQDNGCNFLDTTLLHIKHLRGGDVMETHSNNDKTYALSYNGKHIYYNFNNPVSTNAQWQDIAPANSGEWITPFLINPGTDSVFTAYNDIWSALNPAQSSDWTTLPNSNLQNGKNYISLAMTSANKSLLFAADDSAVYRFDLNTGTNTTFYDSYGYSKINTICIADDTTSRGGIMWIGFAGFDFNDRVTYTVDSGNTWINYSNGLPDLPVYCIKNIPGDSLLGVFAATPLGVYYRDTTMSEWQLFNTGIPFVPIMDFQIDTATDKIVAATFGRGAWISPINRCLTPPAKPEIKSDGGEVICPSESFQLHANSPCADIYLWSTGQTTESITITAPGTYTLTVSNSYGTSEPAIIKIFNANETGVKGKSFPQITGNIRKIVTGADNNYYLTGFNSADYHAIFVMKLDEKLNILWQKTIGGPQWKEGWHIAPTRDSGCIVVGAITPDAAYYFYRTDYYVAKLSKYGTIQWERTFGGYLGDDRALNVDPTDDGYLIIGQANGNAPIFYKSWIIKIDMNGNYIWEIGSANPFNGGYKIKSTYDHGFITSEANHQICTSYAPVDNCILKYDSTGNIQWCNFYSPIDSYNPDIILTKDSGYLILGQAVPDALSLNCNSGDIVKVTKINKQGQTEWSYCPGKLNLVDAVNSNDSGFILLNWTWDTTASYCAERFGGLTYLSPSGAILSTSCFEQEFITIINSITKSKFGGIVAAGSDYHNYGYVANIKKNCPQPYSGFGANNITSTAARVNWATRPCAQSYKVFYRAQGASVWKERITGANSGFKFLTNLLPDTKYEWKVQSKCDDFTFSDYSPVQKFKTLPLNFARSSDENEPLEYSVYPNPNTGYATLKSDNPVFGNIKWELYNSVGLVVMSSTIISKGDFIEKEINISALLNGVYFLKINSDSHSENMKIIKL